MKKILYLAKNLDGTKFKIGISDDAIRRLLNIRRSCWGDVLFLDCHGKARLVEGALHRVFHKYRIREEGSGGTEWYSMECYQLMIDFLANFRELLDIGEFSRIRKTAFFGLTNINKDEIKRMKEENNFKEDILYNEGKYVAFKETFDTYFEDPVRVLHDTDKDCINVLSKQVFHREDQRIKDLFLAYVFRMRRGTTGISLIGGAVGGDVRNGIAYYKKHIEEADAAFMEWYEEHKTRLDLSSIKWRPAEVLAFLEKIPFVTNTAIQN